MGRSPCCENVGLKKGPWIPEEDTKLLAYIEEHGHGSWRALPIKAGLQRCGKSCRLRWTNYLRPDIKRGKFSSQEEQTIIQLHALLGNRWSAIATQLPKRTDNEIKNHWNTHLKKRLTKMGIDPVTHNPKTNALNSEDGQPGNSTDNHMAHWESAPQKAETRLGQESKMKSSSSTPPSPSPQHHQQQQQQQLSTLDPSAKATTTVSTSLSTSAKLLNTMASQAAKKSFGGLALATALRPSSWLSSAQLLNKMATQPKAANALCIEVVLRDWQGVKSKSTLSGSISELGSRSPHGLESRSPKSTLNFSENSIPNSYDGFSENSTTSQMEIVEILSNFDGEKDGSWESCHGDDVWKGCEKCLDSTVEFELDDQWLFESVKVGGDEQEPVSNFDGFTDLLLLGDSNISQDHSFLIGASDVDQDHISFNGGDQEFDNANEIGGDDYNNQDNHLFTGGDREFNNANGMCGDDDYDQDKNY